MRKPSFSLPELKRSAEQRIRYKAIPVIVNFIVHVDMTNYQSKLKVLFLLINFALSPPFCSCLSRFPHCWSQLKVLVKVKVDPLRTKQAKRKGRRKPSSTPDAGTRKGWVVTDTPQSLGGPRQWVRKSVPLPGVRNPDRPARSTSLCRLSHPSRLKEQTFQRMCAQIVLQCLCRFESALPHFAAHLVQTRPVLKIMSLTLRNKRPVSLIIISNSVHYKPPDTRAMFLKYSTLRFFFNLLLKVYCHPQKHLKRLHPSGHDT
jgi:hypothetical protein